MPKRVIKSKRVKKTKKLKAGIKNVEKRKIGSKIEKKQRLKAILFDMDSTLLRLDVDWKALTERIDKKYFGGRFSKLSPHQFFILYFYTLKDKLSKSDQKAIYNFRLKAELKGVETSFCFPYIPLIKELGKNYKIGVISNNYSKTIEKALKHCGLLDYIDIYVSVEMSGLPKPSTKPIDYALKELNVKQSEAVFVGDHPDDILSGKRAGVKTIGVLTESYKDTIKIVDPDLIVKDLRDLKKKLKKVFPKS